MNLLLRLCLVFLLSQRRRRLHILDTCVTPFRVWPNDLDVLRHMTNGRYFAILDLARVDLLLRSRVWQRVNAQRWYPVVTLETIRFHRSLHLWERYDVTTRVIGWDEKHVFLEQGFIRGGTQVAIGVVRTRFLKRGGGTVPTRELLAWIGVTQPSPDLPEWVVQWNGPRVARRCMSNPLRKLERRDGCRARACRQRSPWFSAVPAVWHSA
ncbi:MAG: thioesterase family protein [Burkholderia gladioli]